MFINIRKISYLANMEPPKLKRQRGYVHLDIQFEVKVGIYNCVVINDEDIEFNGLLLNVQTNKISHFDGERYIFLGFYADDWVLTTSVNV